MYIKCILLELTHDSYYHGWHIKDAVQFSKRNLIYFIQSMSISKKYLIQKKSFDETAKSMDEDSFKMKNKGFPLSVMLRLKQF